MGACHVSYRGGGDFSMIGLSPKDELRAEAMELMECTEGVLAGRCPGPVGVAPSLEFHIGF